MPQYHTLILAEVHKKKQNKGFFSPLYVLALGREKWKHLYKQCTTDPTTYSRFSEYSLLLVSVSYRYGCSFSAASRTRTNNNKHQPPTVCIAQRRGRVGCRLSHSDNQFRRPAAWSGAAMEPERRPPAAAEQSQP